MGDEYPSDKRYEASPDAEAAPKDDAVTSVPQSEPHSHSHPHPHPQPVSPPATEPQAQLVPRPRLWPLLVVVLASAVSFLIVSGISLFIAQLLVTGQVATTREAALQAAEMIKQSRLAFSITVILPQIALVMPAVIAALLSPDRFAPRMGLVAGRWPMWAWFAAAAATPLVGMASGVFVSLFLEESTALKQTSELLRTMGSDGFLIPLALLIGGMPAICEELLFRGYLQNRLTRRLPPITGIVIASAVFAIFHMDPVHIVAVFPIGLWMGWLSFRSGSLYPAMIAHLVNNVLAVTVVVLNPQESAGAFALPAMFASLFMLGAGVLGLAGVAAAAYFFPPPVPARLLRAEAVSDAGLA